MEKNVCFETMTDEELANIVNVISRIQTNRRAERRKKLIENFHQAWKALKENGIEIIYGEYEIDAEIGAIELSKWDCFDFN